MRSEHIIKINALGGIFTPLKMKSIVEIAFKADTKNINFGPRQEIYFNIHKENLADFDSEMNVNGIEYELDKDTFPNILSSFPAEGIFTGHQWLTEGIYKDIFAQFDFKPRLKINICDKDQSLVSFFTGDLNFITSPTYQYWFLYVNLNNSDKLIRWDRMIYTTDIPKICAEIEELYLNNKITDLATIMSLVNENTSFLFEETSKELELSRYVFPYYEGMNSYGDRFWAGIYRRDYMFPISFIHELCTVCVGLNISQICITPWRTLIIKGIEQSNKIQFEKLFGKHGVNLRHSLTELNWIVNDINSDELDLKKYVISQLDSKDIRTFGLVFGIKLQSDKHIPASVIIEEKPFIQRDGLKLLTTYNIYYSENFNPNNPSKTLFARNIRKSNITVKLLELFKMYYETLHEIETITIIDQPKPLKPSISIEVYQCKHCLTIYDERYGDEFSNIKPLTSFNSLDENYTCPVCDSSKTDFIKINESAIILT
jgi:rubredoxin